MSRSSFAARFTKVVGETPMQYVTSWRLRKAASLLRDGGASVGEVAAQVGYDSEASFNKAFKRSIGVAPGAYRRSVTPAASVWT
jgi:AraC-like DNA-binding protein